MSNSNGMPNLYSVVGINSHTTMIDGLGIARCGVGGLEVETTLIGRKCLLNESKSKSWKPKIILDEI